MIINYQQQLDQLTEFDTYGFLKDIETNYETHRPLLWLGLNLSGGIVTEMGAGEGSTPYLRKYCQSANRLLYSFDSNREWASKMDVMYEPRWNMDGAAWQRPCGLLFIDHAPGEHRKDALWFMKDRADIIVIHDTELNGGGAYGFEPVLPMFKYVIHFNRTGGGAGASMVSNKIDISVYKGCSFAGRVIE